MFYVINRATGEVMRAEGFWAIAENGQLVDVVDGWGCEGGGGSSSAPFDAVAVFGVEPAIEEPKPEPKPPKVYAHKCSCGARFTTYLGFSSHCNDTKQPGPHVELSA